MTTTAPQSPSSTASDEDSIKLVWQDDAGADLKSLFAKDMMSMTQQIDGWDDSDDDDEDSDEEGCDEINGSSSKTDSKEAANDNPNAKKSPAPPPNPKARKQSLPKSLKIGQNLTPPPNHSTDAHPAVHSAETPATISKLKRKRNHRNVTLKSAKKNGRRHEGNELQLTTTDEKKQKISASQEVDRVFDYLGLPPDNDESKQDKSISTSTQLDYNISAVKDAVGNSRVSTSPMPCGRLFSAGAKKSTIGCGIKRERQKLKLPPLRPTSDKAETNGMEDVLNGKESDVEDLFKEIEMGLDRVTGASQDGDAENKATESDEGAKSGNTLYMKSTAATDYLGNKSNANESVASTSGQLQNRDFSVQQASNHHAPVRGLLCALEPKANVDIHAKYQSATCALMNPNCKSVAGPKLTNNHVSKPVPTTKGVPGALKPATGINVNRKNQSTSGAEWNNSQSTSYASSNIQVKPPTVKRAAVTNLPCISTATTTNLKTHHVNSTNQQHRTANKTNDEFEFDDWNDEDLAEIDQCIAMTQCKVTKDLLGDNEFDDTLDDDFAAVDIPLPASNIPSEHDEFGDDDDELAALDLSAAITQPDNKIMNSFESSFGEVTNPRPVSNVSSAGTGGFSDDEFADLDFEAIDNKIAQHEMQVASRPSKHIPMQNRRSNGQSNTLCFTRYVIRSVEDNFTTSTKTLGVSLWTVDEVKSKSMDELESLRRYQDTEAGSSVNAQNPVHGYVHLRGIWYYSKCCVGDVIHLISISGHYATDTSALPVVLDSGHAPNVDQDDLVLVIHPDELITPTLISEAVTCPRLSVLQQRLGSTGLSARSAVIGTLRHDLFERCLQEHTASRQSAAVFTRQIIRDNAESLVGCGITDQKDAFSEVMKTLPQIQRFLQTYTSWDGTKVGQMKLGNANVLNELKGEFPSSDTLFSIKDIYATEQMTMCPELGLKGYVDVNVEATTKPPNSGSVSTSLMPIELKTGHSQTIKSNHSAQLAVYTVLLRARHGTSSNNNTGNGNELGAASSGMLLYLNDKSFNAIHIKPTLLDAKNLIGQRNDVACDSLKASRPRGITIEYNEDGRTNVTEQKRGGHKAIINPPPPNALPSLNPKINECERCYKSRECMMYASSSVGQLNPGHRRLSQHFTSHLNNADMNYFRHWDRLIDLEKHAVSKDIAVKSWLIESSEREKTDGDSISSLVLDKSSLTTLINSEKSAANEDRVLLRFSKCSDTSQPINISNFECGNYVLLSTDTPFLAPKRVSTHKMHILKGCVVHISERCVEVSVSKRDVVHVKRLCEASNVGMKYRLDKDEFANGMGLLHQNLVNFLTLDIPSFSTESFGQTPSKTKSMTANTEDSRRRRRLQSCITQLHPPPRFDKISMPSIFHNSSFAISVPGCEMSDLKREFDRLNSDQKTAILKVISAEDFAVIQGLPGTGKSATVSFLTRLLVAQGKRVLLTSYTHSAVDNLFCKLLDSGLSDALVRIGREMSCHPRVHATLAQNIACAAETASSAINSDPIKTPNINFLHNVVSSAKVIGVTALTAPKSPLLSGQHFDYVIVDEAGQINQPAILGAITAADKFVLVGDHMQLPPLSRSQVAEQAGFGVSMLSHLAEGFPESVAKLTMQYRMHEDIQSLSNIIAYNGLLKCGNELVKNGTLPLKQYPLQQSVSIGPVDRAWIDHCIAPSNPVVFIDTDGLDEGLEGVGPVNRVESVITARLVTALSAAGLDASSIGIITPFRSQLRLMTENSVISDAKKIGLELGTVDVFQGRDKPAIILSLVRSNLEGKTGRLLQDFRRLNVAFSRAKQKLIMVGSFTTLYAGSDVIRPVLDLIRQKGWVFSLSSLSN